LPVSGASGGATGGGWPCLEPPGATEASEPSGGPKLSERAFSAAWRISCRKHASARVHAGAAAIVAAAAASKLVSKRHDSGQGSGLVWDWVWVRVLGLGLGRTDAHLVRCDQPSTLGTHRCRAHGAERGKPVQGGRVRSVQLEDLAAKLAQAA
jgi:hypothetical protein